MNNAVTLFRLLGDETRYKIVCLLYRSDSYVELLAEQLQLTPGTVCFHLKKLENAGLVVCSRSQFYIIYSLRRELFEQTLSDLIVTIPSASEEERYRQKVLSSFFKGDQLLSIPIQKKKREIVLAKLMEHFSEDCYEEAQVNEILKRYYDDYCTLRRWLIVDGFMDRAQGPYTVLRRI